VRTAFLYKRDAAPLDAITQGSAELARAVADASGHDCPVWEIGPRGLTRRGGGKVTDAEVAERDLLVLEYNPFSYGRWGWAPWLPAQWARLRAGRRGPRLAVRLHEMYVPVEDVRSALMGAWQRAQLMTIVAATDVVYAVTHWWIEEYAGSSRKFVHLPVSSNVPDRRDRRASVREELGIAEGTVALATLGGGHPSRLVDRIRRVADRVRAAATDAVLLNLGEGGPSSGLQDCGLRTITPGPQSDDDVAGHLAAGDVFLAPFVDGVSTRRGSVMAALQHGLAVVTTAGPSTDPVFREADGRAVVLAPAGDAESFAAAAAGLAAAPERRRAVAREGRRLFEETFAWPVVARRLLALAR
jgi:glycosyltransferase involved in cell wall biosynthesis